MQTEVIQNQLLELPADGAAYAELLDCPGGAVRLPVFVRGDGSVRLRYTVPEAGAFRICMKDAAGRELSVTSFRAATAPPDATALQRHGRIGVAEDRSHLRHRDGTPFFWLGEACWHALSGRLSFDDFCEIVAYRRAQGFTVLGLSTGFFCDLMPEGDERCANDAGMPWDRERDCLNRAWFDLADRRLLHIVEAGLVPMLIPAWAWWVRFLGEDRIRAVIDECVARWAALPLIWCVCGELQLPYHATVDEREDARRFQREAWQRLAYHLRAGDPFHNPISAHPHACGNGRADEAVDDPSVFDFNMLQGGHGDITAAQRSLDRARAAVADESELRPIVQGEACFEGMFARCGAASQRLLFWGQMLGGVAGVMYGADGLWQVNGEDVPFGASAEGCAWGNMPWRDCLRLPGAEQMAVGKRILERYDWWRLRPHREWLHIQENDRNLDAPCAMAGMPGELRIGYLGYPQAPWLPAPIVCGLEPGVRYHARFADPITGDFVDLGRVEADDVGNWPVPHPPIMQDWVVILEAESKTR